MKVNELLSEALLAYFENQRNSSIAIIRREAIRQELLAYIYEIVDSEQKEKKVSFYFFSQVEINITIMKYDSNQYEIKF